jgi:hypothetical protein
VAASGVRGRPSAGQWRPTWAGDEQRRRLAVVFGGGRRWCMVVEGNGSWWDLGLGRVGMSDVSCPAREYFSFELPAAQPHEPPILT